MKINRLACVLAVAVALAGCDQQAKRETAASAGKETAGLAELTTHDQKLSYLFGQNIGGQMSAEKINIDPAAFSRGLSDAIAGNESALSQEEVMAVMQAFQQEQMAARKAQAEAAAKLAAENNAKSEAFLTENAGKEGVVTLDSGLQYKVLVEGSGPTPAADAMVEVNYKGTLIDGTEFDSSFKRGQPAQFIVTQVIPGWTEALQLMKEGSKWELYIPPSLAYGPGGTGGPIGPNQALIFEVELLRAAVDNTKPDPKAESETGAEAESAVN